MPVLIALDAGTGGAKVTVFATDGHLLAVADEAWSYTVRSHPDLPFIKEYAFDPDRFWSVLCRCTKQALERAAVDPADVVGVAATSQREGCVFLGKSGEVLYAGPNLDSRAFEEGLHVLGTLGVERLYEITGHSAPFIFAIARYLWFRKHHAEPVDKLLMINDWMTYRLCGVMSAEPSNATESMLFDFRRRDWSDEILETFDIPRSVFPNLHDPGQRVGALRAEVAAATGLAAGTPVFIGGADTQCSLLGAGAVEPGDTAVILGTTSPIQTVVAQPTLDPASNLWAGCHVVPDRWVLESNVGSSGDAYEWLLDLLVPDQPNRHAAAEKLAGADTEGGTFSFMGPRLFDLTKVRPDAPGGIFFRFPSLQLRPNAGELLLSFFESLAFAVRGNVEQLQAVLSYAPACLIAGGGMSRNELLLQLLADVTGLTVRCTEEPESTGLGCAILAASGAGVYGDVGKAAVAMCRHREIHPDDQRHDRYETAFKKWRELYDVLDTLSV
jgi:autoinducer 2 (AI-2) kinase